MVRLKQLYAQHLSICCIVVLVCTATLFSWKACAQDHTVTDPSRRPFLELQERFYQMALMLDAIDWLYLQRQPIPDWLLRVDEKERVEKYQQIYGVLDADGNPSSALAERLLNERKNYHFDVLSLFPREYGAFSESNLRSLRNQEMQIDPFAPNSFLGYISVSNDYCLVSVGPDGKSDILGFVQLVQGDYSVGGIQGITSDWQTIEQLGKRRIDSEKSPATDLAAKIVIPIDTIYDPTNGIRSTGDILFHRSYGDNFLFSYPAKVGVLDESSLIKTDLSGLTKK